MIAAVIGGIIVFIILIKIGQAYILSSRIRRHIQQELNEVLTNPRYMAKGKNE